MPRLLDAGPTSLPADRRTAPPASVRVLFTGWLSQWRSWAGRQRRELATGRWYERLESVVKTLEQHDDEYELVLGVGLLQWAAPGGAPIRRHLVTEAAVPALDRGTAEL